MRTRYKHTGSDDHGSDHVHQYTCKMRLEVVQDSLGNCPKCGMKNRARICAKS